MTAPERATHIPEATPTEAQARLGSAEDRERFRVVDVRAQHEFDGPLGSIEGSELIPLETLEEHVARLADMQPLLLVCRSGRRSADACETLRRRGVSDVTNLAGGMIEWNRARLPVVRKEPVTLEELRDGIVAWLAQVSQLTDDAAHDLVRERFARHRASYEDPDTTALEDLIEFVAESLAQVRPPDLDLSVAYFRHALAVL
jgi:rhodanese-related sulfurtransferase